LVIEKIFIKIVKKVKKQPGDGLFVFENNNRKIGLTLFSDPIFQQ